MRKYEDAWDVETEGTKAARVAMTVLATLVVGAVLAYLASLLF